MSSSWGGTGPRPLRGGGLRVLAPSSKPSDGAGERRAACGGINEGGGAFAHASLQWGGRLFSRALSEGGGWGIQRRQDTVQKV
jgi:hypothetical protein